MVILPKLSTDSTYPCQNSSWLVCKNWQECGKKKTDPTEWDKIFANNISDERFVLKMYIKNYYNSVIKTKTQFLKGDKDPSRHFSKEKKQITNKHKKKRLSMPPVIKKMQIKTTIKYHFTCTRKARINKHWWECVEIGTLILCWWEYKMVQSL